MRSIKKTEVLKLNNVNDLTQELEKLAKQYDNIYRLPESPSGAEWAIDLGKEEAFLYAGETSFKISDKLPLHKK